MKKLPSRAIASGVILTTLAMLFSYVLVGAASESSLERFIRDPSLASWEYFQSEVRTGRDKSNGILFLKLFEYHEAREKRDLPNSMTLEGITPAEFVKLQSKQADLALGYIRKNNNRNFWRVIEKLAVQEFDDGLQWTACEIAARLSPPRFEKIAAEVIKRHTDQSWIIKRIRERWINTK